MSRRRLPPFPSLLALGALLLRLPVLPAATPPWQDLKVGQVLLLDWEQKTDARLLPYRSLVTVRVGEDYSYRDVRRSIENLFQTGVFADIEVKVQNREDGQLDIVYILERKPVIRSLEFTAVPMASRKEMRAAVFSLRRNELFEESKLPKALAELQAFFAARGYFNTQLSPRVNLTRDRSGCDVRFVIAAGKPARIARLQVSVDDEQLAKVIPTYFRGAGPYLPGEFSKGVDRARRLLKKHRYLFPEIKVQEDFLDPQRTQAGITVTVACGFKYHFQFRGMAPRMNLIDDVWKRQVFEKWAEDESRDRLLNYLKNEGFLDARVSSSVTTSGRDKFIVFAVEKRRRYRLGKITLRGNHEVSAAKIREIIRSDDLIFNRLGWLRLNSLVADMEVLRLYYYYQGISPIEIRLEPSFRGRRADIEFHFSEGRKHLMANVEFSGNHAFSGPDLYRLIQSRTGRPYVPKQLSEDIDRLQNFYWDKGYEDATVTYELSPGEEKSLLIIVSERQRKTMGQLIIVGASSAQRNLLRKLFPLEPGQPFSRNKIDAFRAEVDNSAIFSELRLDRIAKEGGAIDVMLRVTPDRGRFYGLGIGWEERRGPRGTVEYQEKNLFRSISSVTATLQLGVNTRDRRLVIDERRGILSVDTPYFFRNKITSSFQLWEENETYPSYQFNRLGLGMSLVKAFSDKLHVLGALKWYRTSLTELAIPPFGVDQLHLPFYTTALSFSFVSENRNNPFNPQRGHFLSADLKLGLPVFEKDYTFLKLYWNYQRHYPFLREGAFSFSVKNGLGFGDMSISERFFAGGSHSFRGARNDRLGPINLVKDKPEGGNILLLFNLEATVPSLLVPMENLYYTFFADVGNVFAKSSDFNLRKMERALGIGLKYRTPLGPIRLDFAFNLRRAAEKNFLVFIGIGNVY